MGSAFLYFPEFPNTFFLTYNILINNGKYGGFDWKTQQCDWNDTIREVSECVNKKEYDVVCFFGTEDSNLDPDSVSEGDEAGKIPICSRLLSCICPLSKKPDSEPKDEESAYECLKIKLPSYHPRFVFVPYDYLLFDKVYSEIVKSDPDSFNSERIVTANDINAFPSWDQQEVKKVLKERGIREPFFSDTKKQAEFIKERLIQGLTKDGEAHQFRVYYYGAPLTIFYLHSYPLFLPIKIDSLFNENDDKYKKAFETYLHVYYKQGVQIDSLVNDIKTSFFKAYVDAIYEPQLLTPVLNTYKETVPRGQFYTMRNVNDFAKAITLHCSPDINVIKEEIWGKDQSADNVKQGQLQILQDIKDRLSDSNRNEDRQRINDFQKIKDTAFGCMVFLLVYLYDTKKGKDYFADVASSQVPIRKDRLPRDVSFLYNSVVTCLTWEFVLSICEASVKDVGGMILTDMQTRNNNCHKDKESLYLRYKKAEKQVLGKHDSFWIKETGVRYKREDLEKFIAYTEYVIKQYVEESVMNKSSVEQKKVYSRFSKLVNSNKSRKGNLLIDFLKKLAPYSSFKYKKQSSV